MLLRRWVVACVAGSIWIGAFDGISRLLTGYASSPSAVGVLVLLGTCLALGIVVGALAGALAAAAVVDGPARPVTIVALESLARAPIWVVVLSAIAFAAPLCVAVPVRASLLSRSAALCAAVDLVALAAGWALASLLTRRLGSRAGRRLSRRAGGAGLFILAGIAAAAATANRSSLVSSDLWDLVLFAEFAFVSCGAAVLLPAGGWCARIALACLGLGLLGGALALYGLHASAELREELALEWRPASWIVGGLTSVIDMDGDGFSPVFGGGDCDDGRDDVNPEGIEIAGNGVDENCRGGDRAPEPPWEPRPTFVPVPSELRAPRSILLVVVDGMRSDHMGCYGYHRETTPRMDALAARGVRFENAYSSAPTTRIAIPVLHTGRHLSEIHWDRTVQPYAMLDDVPTVAEILGRELGFESAAFVTHRFLGRRWGWARGFEEIDTEYVLPQSTYMSEATGAGLAAKAARWIEAHRDDRFFAWIHFLDPHFEYLAHESGPDFGDSDVDRYDSEIFYDDRAVGELLDKLEELGIADETAVVLMSDHGEYLGEHGRRFHGGSLYEEVARIPLIIRSPGLKPRVCRCITGHVDLAPTLLNLLGLDGGRWGMTGGSLVSDMTGASCPPDREIVLEMRYGKLNSPTLRALVGPRWKLIHNASRGTYELFDLETDPREIRDLEAPERERFAELRQRLDSWTEAYGNRELLKIIEENTFDEPPASAEKLAAEFENGLEIVALDFGERRASPVLSPDLQIYLRTRERVRQDCRISLSLWDAAGTLRFSASHPPVTGSFPVARWPLRRVVNDGFAFELRRKLMRNGKLGEGVYEARLGLHCDGREIPASRGDIAEGGRVRCGWFRIEKGDD